MEPVPVEPTTRRDRVEPSHHWRNAIAGLLPLSAKWRDLRIDFSLPTIDGRIPTFALTGDGVTPDEAARRLGDRGLAVWHGN